MLLESEGTSQTVWLQFKQQSLVCTCLASSRTIHSAILSHWASQLPRLGSSLAPNPVSKYPPLSISSLLLVLRTVHHLPTQPASHPPTCAFTPHQSQSAFFTPVPATRVPGTFPVLFSSLTYSSPFRSPCAFFPGKIP